MKKLRLNLDKLHVESFRTGAGSDGGTVVARGGDSPEIIVTDPSRIDSCYFNTCYEGCPWTD